MVDTRPMVASTTFAFALSALVSALLVFFVRRHALLRNLLDQPNDRSSHTVPTPRGGGLGLVVAFLITVCVATRAPLKLADACALVAVLLVAAIGWVDDHGGASVRARLAVHLVSGALVLPLTWVLPLLSLPMWAVPVGWIFWTVAAINVVNFMDGIDGIIGLHTLIYSSYVALMARPDDAAQAAGLALAGASVGFLLWNWSPARIFMGDVGSGSLGVILIVVGAFLLRDGRVDLVAAYAPLVPLFLDATLTLMARARRGERLSDAHRTHLYQRLANGGLGHARVAVGFGVSSVLCAFVATRFPTGGLVLLTGLVSLCLLPWVAADRWLQRRLGSVATAR